MNEWRTYRLFYTQKARKILETLTLEEKVSLMSGCESKKGVRGAIQSKMKTHYNEYPYRAGGLEEKGAKTGGKMQKKTEKGAEKDTEMTTG